MSILRAKNLHKSFGKLEVLKGINLSVEPGEVVAMVGPSGSGKSTLLRCLNLMELPTSGSVYYKDDELSGKKKEAELNRLRENIGMVFQHFHLFPHLSVLENITLAPKLTQGLKQDEAEERAKALLAKVGLSDKVHAYPDKLSGGQKQRVAIARALAMEPEVMLFDEPTSALDPEMVKEVLNVIKDLVDEGLTTLIVTHEMRFARQIASRILFLDEGRIIEDAPPEQFFSEQSSPRARQFLDLVTY